MSIRRIIRKFARRTEGAILVMVAMGTVIFLGFVALSFDLGRVASTQSELQSFADNVALAAAGELDGGSDAITRANAAADRIADKQTFGGGGQDLDSDDYVLTFYETLPDDDRTGMPATPLNPADPDSNAKAAYVRAVVDQHTVGMPFAAAFSALTGGTTESAIVAAEAVAGYTAYACDITPMMFCLPPGFKADEHVGEMMRLRSGGSGAAWQPGNFGFLDTSGIVNEQIAEQCQLSSEVQTTKCQLAAAYNRTGCFAQRGVGTKPGQNQGTLSAALNVRFDMYESSAGKMDEEEIFAPAANIVQGQVITSCNSGTVATTTDTMSLPWDSCFAAGTCVDQMFGDGEYSWDEYIDKNHGDGDGIAEADEWPGDTTSASTRYEMYLAEIEAAGDMSNPILPDRSEDGRPHCSQHISPDPERRTLIVAGVDCVTNGFSGNAENVPVKEFVKLFLTHPVGLGPPADTTATKFDVWAEVVGSAGGPGSGGTPEGIFHEVVQLYR